MKRAAMYAIFLPNGCRLNNAISENKLLSRTDY